MFHLFRKPRVAIPTDEGSVTFLDRRHHQTFHSTYGPIEESQIVFVKNGFLFYCEQNPLTREVHILEMGFGTGLNALLTAEAATERGIKVFYTTYERYPLHKHEYNLLHFPGTDAPLLETLHTLPWNIPCEVTPFFCIEKRKGDFRKAHFDREQYEVVYYDAFSPDEIPELWDAKTLSKVACVQPEGGLFVTYTVKGTLRRTLHAIGYEVERLAGTRGKRQVLRAVRYI